MEQTIAQLVKNNILLSRETKEHILEKITGWSTEQQSELRLALEQSDRDLKHIITMAMKDHPEKFALMKQRIDDIWKEYCGAIEKSSEKNDESAQDELLKRLDE